MRHRGRFIGAIVLALVLHHSAVAGVIHTPAPAPPPPETVTSGGQITTGVTEPTDTPSVAGVISTPASSADSVVDMALSLVRSVLALF